MGLFFIPTPRKDTLYKKKVLPVLKVTEDIEFGKKMKYYHLPGSIVISSNKLDGKIVRR